MVSFPKNDRFNFKPQRTLLQKTLFDITLHGESIFNYYSTLNQLDIDWQDEKSIERVFNDNENFGLFINLKKLERNGISLPNCGIAIYKKEIKIDFELNFQLSDFLQNFKIEGLTKKLMKLAKSIAIHHQVSEYYCGLEPAQETHKRLFTNEHLGPLSLE